MKIKVIHNPYSNRWNSAKRWPEVEALLREYEIKYDVVHSADPASLYELARLAAIDGYDHIVAAGGDGTIGTVVNAITHTVGVENLPTFGLLPLGTGNDFAYAMGISTDLKEAVSALKNGKTRQIDLGKVNDIYFINNCGLGIEPYVTVIQSKITWIKGMIRYLVAAVNAIMDKPVWSGELKWHGGEYKGPLSLAYIGNGCRTGGMFYMGLNSVVDDGMLTVVYGFKPNRRSMFAVLPKTMMRGDKNYVTDPDIHEVFTDRLSIKLENPSPMHTDGEVAKDFVSEAEFSIFPGAVRFLVP